MHSTFPQHYLGFQLPLKKLFVPIQAQRNNGSISSQPPNTSEKEKKNLKKNSQHIVFFIHSEMHSSKSIPEKLFRRPFKVCHPLLHLHQQRLGHAHSWGTILHETGFRLLYCPCGTTGHVVPARCLGHSPVSTPIWFCGQEHHPHTLVSFLQGQERTTLLDIKRQRSASGVMLWATLALKTQEQGLRLQLQRLILLVLALS